MSKITYRERPRRSDVEIVGVLLKATGFFSDEEQEIGISLIRERLEEGEASTYRFVFAEDQGEVIGYTCFGPIPGTMCSYDLYWIAVDPQFQGRKVGSLLLRYTEDRVRSAEGRQLYAETSSRDQYMPTRTFYERNGFILEGRLVDYYAPDDDKMLFVKRLVI